MHVTTRRRQRRCYFEYSLRQLRTMGSTAPVLGGDGGAGQGLRVDAEAAMAAQRQGKAAAVGGLSLDEVW